MHVLKDLWKFVMDREVWRAAVHGVSKGQIWLSNWTECICMEFRRTVLMILHAGCQGDIDVKNRLLNSVGEGKGRMIWENITETCTKKIHDQCKFDAWKAPKASALGQPKGIEWGGRWEESSGWGELMTCIPVAYSCWCMAKPSQYCKVIIFQLK